MVWIRASKELHTYAFFCFYFSSQTYCCQFAERISKVSHHCVLFLADRTYGRAYGTMFCPSVVCRLSVCNVLYCGQTVRRRGSAMVPLDRALVSSYRLSVVTMSLSAAVWPQFAMQLSVGGAGSYRYIATHVSK